ncbi:hypothetical protein IPM19_02150 [bacterium]|nr:MAG: hypothetical protein IPM19_02150 [bacterium]
MNNELNGLATFPSAAGTEIDPAVAAGLGVFWLILMVGFYIYYSFTLYRIAQKTNTPNEWLAWVPIVNFFYAVKIARVSNWWILAMLVPFVNIFVIAYVWMKISEIRRRPQWFGILMLISPINLIVLWFLAFKEADDANNTAPPAQPVPPAAPTPPAQPTI